MFLGVVGTLLIASVAGLFILLGTGGEPAEAQEPGQTQQDPGLLGNPENVLREPVETVTGEDLQQQYENNPGFDDLTVEQLEATIMQKLSLGDFSGLDMYLQDINSRYSTKVDEDENGEIQDDIINYTLKINNIRSDLAILTSMVPENAQVMFTSFNTPEVCAAALVYKNIDEKLDVFLNEDAKIYNGVQPGTPQADVVNLRVAEMNDSERGDLLVSVNNAHNNEYLEVKAYDCTIHDLPYRLLVAQASYGQWRPYTIQSLSTNGEDRDVATVYELKQMRNENPYFDFSSLDYDLGGETGAPGLINREGEGFESSGDPNTSEDPNTTQVPGQPADPNQTVDPSNPSGINPSETTDPSTQQPPAAEDPVGQLSAADQQAMADLQKIMDNFDPNTTDLSVIKGTLDQIKAIAARPDLSDVMKAALDQELSKLQSSYDTLAAIFGAG